MFRKNSLRLIIFMSLTSYVGYANSSFYKHLLTMYKKESVVEASALSGIAVGVASATTMYWLCREANSSKIEKVERLWRHVTDNVARTHPNDFSRLVPVFKDFDIFAFELKKDLDGRYANWTTPWNWFPSMRLAYKKVTLLTVLFKYLDVLRYWHAAIPDEAIERLARTVCGQEYSVMSFVRTLNEDIELAQSMMKDVYCPFGTILCEHLKAIRDIAMRSNAYVVESQRPIDRV